MAADKFDANSKADNLLKDMNTLIDSSSGMQKFELHQQVLDEWNSLSCSQRIETGKALEDKSAGRSDTVIKASFDYKNGEIKALEFSKAVPRRRSDFVVYDLVKEKFQEPLSKCLRDK